MSSHKLTQRLFPRALKLLPLAALLAASGAWADSGGNDTGNTAAEYAGGATGSNVTVDTKPGSRTNGGTWDNAAGGYGNDTSVTGNTLTIESTGEVATAFGGYTTAYSSTATGIKADNNTLNIRGTVTAAAYGGFCEDCEATNNKVNIEAGATVSGDVYGGVSGNSGNPTYSGSSGATNNTVTLGCGASVSGSVQGGYCAVDPTTGSTNCSGDAETKGNTLDACDATVGGGGDNFETVICRPKNRTGTCLTAGKFTPPANLVFDDSGMPQDLQPGDTIEPIRIQGATGPLRFPSFTGGGRYDFEDDGSGGLRVKTVNRLITVEASPAEGGNVTCTAPLVTGSSNKYKVADGGELTCTAKPNEGYGLTGLTLKLLSGSGWTCDESTLTCTLTGITKDMTATVNFTKGGGAPGTPGTPGVSDTFGSGGTITGTLNPDGSVTYTGGSCPTGDCGNNSSPAMGELGLLLSGLALAGAAAPALRRRKQGKKG